MPRSSAVAKSTSQAVTVRATRLPGFQGERFKLLGEHVTMLEEYRVQKKPLREVYALVEKTWRAAWPQDFDGEVATKGDKKSRKREPGVKKPMREVWRLSIVS